MSSELNCFEVFTKNYKKIQALVAGLKGTERLEHNIILAEMIVEMATAMIENGEVLYKQLLEMPELCSTSEVGKQVSQTLVSYFESLMTVIVKLASSNHGSNNFYTAIEEFKKVRFEF